MMVRSDHVIISRLFFISKSLEMTVTVDVEAKRHHSMFDSERTDTREQRRRRCAATDLPFTDAGLTGSMRDTISARSVKEALGHVRT